MMDSVTTMRHRLLPIGLCLVLGMSTTVEVLATTIYSYIDDQGNPVFTDSPETIPEKYRAKVKSHEQPGSVEKAHPKSQSSATEASGRSECFWVGDADVSKQVGRI